MQINFHKGWFCSGCDHPSAKVKLLYLLSGKGVCVWKYKILNAATTITPTSSLRDRVNGDYSLRLSKRIIICNDSFGCSIAEVNSCRGQRRNLYLLVCQGYIQRARDAFYGLWVWWKWWRSQNHGMTEVVRDLWRFPCPCRATWSRLHQGGVNLTHGWKNHCHFSQHCSHWNTRKPPSGTAQIFINSNSCAGPQLHEQRWART